VINGRSGANAPLTWGRPPSAAAPPSSDNEECARVWAPGRHALCSAPAAVWSTPQGRQALGGGRQRSTNVRAFRPSGSREEACVDQGEQSRHTQHATGLWKNANLEMHEASRAIRLREKTPLKGHHMPMTAERLGIEASLVPGDSDEVWISLGLRRGDTQLCGSVRL